MKTITVAGGNLFAIAAQQYGDATQWYLIAAANGLKDPFLNGVVTLSIPPAQTTGGTDGILGLP
jgi:nucleoid-associated protein YgaU